MSGAAAPGHDRRAPDVLLVLGAIGSIQISAAVATHMFDRVGAAGATFVRTAIAAAILLALVRPRWRALDAAGRRAVVPYGIALGVMNMAFYLGVDRVDLGVAVAIEFLGPLTVGAVMARRARDRAWVVVAALGVLALTEPWSADAADPIGVAWLLLAALCWGLYIPLGARAAAQLPGLEPVAIAMVMAALVALVPGVIEGGGDLGQGYVLAIGALTAITGSVVPYSLEQLALRRIPPGIFGVLMALEPAVALLAGLAVLGQQPHVVGLLGIVLVVAAGVGVTRAASPATAATPVP
ncbi:EamA family transporter [Patulibacter defluvii]|uniref:EamA family transporter n=1 Tax=Patulibacter defluvii TaxID=3095358 RepID=UPI002A755FAD|nr:EamA family transporter [Patulibacter sp. DM4]